MLERVTSHSSTVFVTHTLAQITLEAQDYRWRRFVHTMAPYKDSRHQHQALVDRGLVDTIDVCRATSLGYSTKGPSWSSVSVVCQRLCRRLGGDHRHVGMVCEITSFVNQLAKAVPSMYNVNQYASI